MRAILSALAVLTAHAVIGETRPVQTGPDLANLYERVSGSTYIVKGRAVARSAVSLRVRPPSIQIGPNLWKRDISLDYLSLFDVVVDQIIFREADLVAEAPAPTLSATVLKVFVPSAEPPSAQSRFDPNRRNRREWLLPEREYLMFLYEPGGQDALVKTYKLEPGVVYYRTVEGQRGAVALPDATHPERPRDFITPLVQAVTTFCGAVKGPDMATKIRQLQAVRDSFDYPAWRKSVDAAIYDFQNPGPRRMRQP